MQPENDPLKAEGLRWFVELRFMRFRGFAESAGAFH